MTADDQLTVLSGRLHELTQQRAILDAQIRQLLSQLTAHYQTLERPMTTQQTSQNGHLGLVPLVKTTSPPILPPDDTVQSKVLAWLRIQEQPQRSSAIAAAIAHPHKALKSTLNAMRRKGLLGKASRDQWKVTT